MCGIVCSASTIVVGAVLVVASCVISFVVVPNVIETLILRETLLHNDSVQLERFKEIPFPLNFTVRFFNLTNSEDYVNGAVPVVEEIGPYVYKLYQTRQIVEMEEDIIRYHRVEHYEFDPEASYPYSDNDMVTIVNVPFHALVQIADASYSSLVPLLNLAMGGIFGEFNSPVATFRVQDLLFNGIQICKNSGVVTNIACNIIREIGADVQNLQELEDGSLVFSVLGYKQDIPSDLYEVSRGLKNFENLGEIISYGNRSYFNYWTNDTVWGDLMELVLPGVCNMINGTDAGIFAPFVDRSKQIYAINTDVCRSVELRYEDDSEYEGIPTVRYVANEWLLDNDEGCFCLNLTKGITRGDGCLLKGAMELRNCIGAPLVMSYPHFLYADEAYRDGVVGMNPQIDEHRIYLDIEPFTGTPIRGYKRAQFNIFSRRISGIGATSSLRTTLIPFVWIEEGITLPEEFTEEISKKLLNNLRLVDILIPVLIAMSCFVPLLGIGLTIRAKYKKREELKSEIGGVNRSQ